MRVRCPPDLVQERSPTMWLMMDDVHPTNWFLLKPNSHVNIGINHLRPLHCSCLCCFRNPRRLECDDKGQSHPSLCHSQSRVINSWHFMILIVRTLTIQTLRHKAGWLHLSQLYRPLDGSDSPRRGEVSCWRIRKHSIILLYYQCPERNKIYELWSITGLYIRMNTNSIWFVMEVLRKWPLLEF